MRPLRQNFSLETFAYGLAFLSATAVLCLTLGLAWMLWNESAASRASFGWAFFWSLDWDPVREHFGALPFIYGTLLSTLLAILIALPAGLGAAIYLAEMAPPFIEAPLSRMVELLAALPSVVYGLLASLVLVPFLRQTVQPPLGFLLGWTPFFSGPFLGVGYLAAGLILGIMILPILISLARESLKQVPVSQREAALGLGATQAEVILQVVIPYARRGIAGATFLALARAMGETMAVTMVIGNSPVVSASLFSPGYTIASVLANEFTEASSNLHLAALSQLAFALFVISFAMQLLARFWLGDKRT